MKLLPRPIEPERAVKDDFTLIAHHCDPQVIDQLPSDIKNLWPERARTYRQRRA